jgi:hypothetical protein
MPSLYEGLGSKGTDKVVLELPRVINGTWGSILSGITCAGAFAAFMSCDAWSAMCLPFVVVTATADPCPSRRRRSKDTACVGEKISFV